MKLLLVAHGYPPELVGGTEASVRSLARGLVRDGLDVAVVAGTIAHGGGFRISTEEDVDPQSGRSFPVLRVHRDDLYFDHWQKSASARVAEAFRGILREERPDVVHVHHWVRLTRDLVACAAREGVPAVVTLHDLWPTCLIGSRVRPDTGEACEATLAPDPCLDCAALVPPRTPWVSRESQTMAFFERRSQLERELRLARSVVAPSRAHAHAVEGFFGLAEGSLDVRVVAHGRDVALARREPLPAPPESGRLVLSTWGHLLPLKGVDLILEAIASLPEADRVELHVAGEGTDRGYVARLARMARGLEVRFHGAFRAEELDRHPATAAHAMVSGTRARETWGLVVDEAVALGLPMVLPSSGAFPERVGGKGALLYEPGDAASLAAALRSLLEVRGALAGLRAALPALEEVCPSVATHVEELLALYRGAREAGPPEPPAEEWWQARMGRAREEDWDASLRGCDAAELGLGEAGG